MPDLNLRDAPEWVHWSGAAALLAALGKMGWQWMFDRGQHQRRLDDRFAAWTARREEEQSAVHAEMRAEIERLRNEVDRQRDRGDRQDRLITTVSTFTVTLYLMSTQLAQTVISGNASEELARLVLDLEPPEGLKRR